MSIHRIGAIVAVSLGLSGCVVGGEIAGDVRLVYDGIHRDAVVACALEAADGARRDDALPPGDIVLSDIGLEWSPQTALVRMTGVLEVTDASGSGEDLYEWACHTDEGASDPTIVSFEPSGDS